MRVLLVAAPWYNFQTPSLQIETLATYLRRRVPTVEAEALHAFETFVDVLGPDVYQRVHGTLYLGELCMATLLSPGRAGEYEALYRQLAPELAGELSLAAVTSKVEEATRRLGALLDSAPFDALGLSATSDQLLASLWIARHVRRTRPGTPILLGGMQVSEGVGESLLKACAELDFVVEGPGEEALARLAEGAFVPGAELPANVLWREGAVVARGGRAVRRVELAQVPAPTCTQFLQQRRGKGLPVCAPYEFSRGCAWGRCQFCGDTAPWPQYQRKTPEQAAEEISALVREGVRDVYLVDSLFPYWDAKLVGALAGLPVKPRYHRVEVRSGVSRAQLAALKSAGMASVLVGIESFGPGLLRRMNKGATVLQNVRVLRLCAELGVQVIYNILPGFPGESPEEAAEAIAVMKAIHHLPPPCNISHFYVVRGSPIERDPSRWGLQELGMSREYRALFADELGAVGASLILDDAGRDARVAASEPQVDAANVWSRAYRTGERRWLATLPGGLRLHRRVDGRVRTELLYGLEASVARQCDSGATLEKLEHALLPASSAAVATAVSTLVDRGVLLETERRYLCVIPVDPPQEYTALP